MGFPAIKLSHPPTLADIDALPPHMKGEIINGVFYAMTRPRGAIKRALAGVRKLLLTATPLQNSLLELYGLSTIIDEHLFGDRVSFRSRFMRGD